MRGPTNRSRLRFTRRKGSFELRPIGPSNNLESRAVNPQTELFCFTCVSGNSQSPGHPASTREPCSPCGCQCFVFLVFTIEGTPLPANAPRTGRANVLHAERPRQALPVPIPARGEEKSSPALAPASKVAQTGSILRLSDSLRSASDRAPAERLCRRADHRMHGDSFLWVTTGLFMGTAHVELPQAKKPQPYPRTASLRETFSHRRHSRVRKVQETSGRTRRFHSIALDWGLRRCYERTPNGKVRLLLGRRRRTGDRPRPTRSRLDGPAR